MIEITMPRLSDTMEEGAISTWHKQPGDSVEIGDVLVEIETDKATMEYEAYEAGTLSKILVPEGEVVAIGAPIALLDDGSGPQPGAGDQESSAPEAAEEAGAAEPAEGDRADEAPEAAAEAGAAGGDDTGEAGEGAAGGEEQGAAAHVTQEAAEPGERRFASPYVRKLARDHRLDLSSVTGSGPGGRIVRADIEGLLPGSEPGQAPAGAKKREPQKTEPQKTEEQRGEARAPKPAAGDLERRGSEEVELSNIRRVIARRVGESASTIPHFFVTAKADAERFMAVRAELNEQLVAAGRPKVSVNDLLIRACALALREHPLVNASYTEDGPMLVHQRVNVGIAVAAESGLVVPVLDDADTKTVTVIAEEAGRLIELAGDRKLTPAQMSGGTFTISNLGMFGVEEFTAIINPPEGAILAVGGTKREPVVVGDEIVPRYVMRYTLSSDHRIIDGALAARFLQTLTRLIENPWTILA